MELAFTPGLAKVAGTLCIVVSLIGWLGAAVCWLTAMTHRRPGTGLMSPDFWFRLTPEGNRFRNWGFFWFVTSAAAGLCGMLLLG